MAKFWTFLKSLLNDKTYAKLWYWIVDTTEGHRVALSAGAVLTILVLAIIAINIPAWPAWTGFGTKNVWDLANLLLVPIVLALIAYFFNKRQKERDIAIAKDRNQEAALQNYLDKMTELLLPPNNLRGSAENSDSEVRSIARSRTLTVLRGLDGERKGSVVQFLYESGLIMAEKTIISLKGAQLKGAQLVEATFNTYTTWPKDFDPIRAGAFAFDLDEIPF